MRVPSGLGDYHFCAKFVKFCPELFGNGLEVTFSGGQIRTGAFGQHCRQVLGRWLRCRIVRRWRPIAILGGRAHRFPASLFLRAAGRAVLLSRAGGDARRRPVMIMMITIGGQIFRFGSFDHVHVHVQIFGPTHRSFAFSACVMNIVRVTN